MPETIDSRRVFLGYLFFTFGLILTLYQYFHLIKHGGPMEPAMRQISMIFVNTLAVYIGWVLVIPWHAKGWREGSIDYQGKPHFQWMLAMSLIVCFITMVGLAIALIKGPTTYIPTTATIGSDLFGDVKPAEPVTVFPLSSYAIAALYMVGYGVLGIGPKILRWVLRQVTGRTFGSPSTPEEEPAPKPKPTKKKTYPIETRFVVGRVRKRATTSKREPENTAQD
ncbi:MAG: hypothetical protein ACI8T1_003011 [Verrucomicrobiales bacterium]|jgi:hypothetical protein